MVTDILALLAALAIGSVPLSWLLARYRFGVDLRTVGDGNVGSGNLIHLGGMPAVLAATILDLLKGAAAVALAIAITSDEWVVLTAGVLVVVGHVFPPWLAFHGGRGAAAAIGVGWALFPLSGLVMLALGLVTLVATRRTPIAIACAVIALIVVAVVIERDASRLLFVALLFIGVGLKDAVDRVLARRASG